MASVSIKRFRIPSPQAITTAKQPRLWLILIVMAFVVLSITTSTQLPLYEGFDEAAHYRVVDDYARHAALPDLARAPSHEAHQPPLYYAIGALLIAPIDRSDFDTVFQINPNSAVNVRQNIAAPEPWRLSGTTLALRILRLFSCLLGALTLLLTYALARQLQLSAPYSLLATAFLAFNPKFIELSAAVSNDIAAICAATACLVVCARVMRQRPQARWTFVLGISVGLAALCKNSGLGLGLPALFALVISATQLHHRRVMHDVIAYGAITALGVLLVMGWLWAVQWVHYGSPLAWEQVNQLNRFTLRASPLDVGQFIAMLPGILPTLWRINPALPMQAVGDVLAISVLLVAATGWVIGIIRRSLPGAVVLLPVAILGSLIALAPWMRLYGGTEDTRLLPTTFPGMAVLFAIGVAMVATRTRAHSAGMWIAGLSAGLSLVWACIAPFALVAPTFPASTALPTAARVQQLSAAARDHLPKVAVAQFENGIELAQAVVQTDRLNPGEPVPLILTWRVTRPVMLDYLLTIEAFDTQGHSLGKLDARPLAARRWTVVWQVGDVYSEAVSLPTSAITSEVPVVATLFVGWHEADPPHTISGIVGSTALSAPLGRIKLRATQPLPPPQSPVDAVYGGAIALDGYDVQSGTMTLHWRALKAVTLDYQVFVHVVNADNTPAGQADGPLPIPATLWDIGEMIIDPHAIGELQTGASALVGVYDLKTNARLPALRADGSRWQDDSAILGR